MRKLLFLTVVMLSLQMIPPAYAHRPGNGSDGVTIISDAETSFAYYRDLISPDQIDIYQFEGEAGLFFHAGINIPQIEGLENYGVTMALLGPGLPPLDHSQLPIKDANSRPEMPGLVLTSSFILSSNLSTQGTVVESQMGEEFYEPFTQTNYWKRQVLELNLPESGTYTLLVWNPGGETGKYVLDTGTKEVFGLGDLFRFPGWWMDTRAYFGQTPNILAGSSLVFIGLIAGITRVLVLRRLS